MAQFNENIKIAAPNPIDDRYLSTRTSGGSQLPYSGLSEVYSIISTTVRYTGLTVLIKTGSTSPVEYWFKDNITTLVEKKYDSILPQSEYVTGGTNIGYFSGKTGVQTLPIYNLPDAEYNGDYDSIYNYYYRDINGIITIGIPTDNILKRGYVKTSSTPSEIKSWIWNEYLGGPDLLGWILVDGNIADLLGTYQDGYTYYGATTSYSATTWTTGMWYNNGSDLLIATVIGSLISGDTISIGGPVYNFMNNNKLHFRTIKSKTPNTIKITNDTAFVYISGSTGTQLLTASNGLTKVGTNVELGGTITGTTTLTLTGSSSLIITDSRTIPSGIQYDDDYGSTFTDRSLIDKGYLDIISSLGGERIYKLINQSSHGFDVNDVLGWSGGTYNKPIADGTYDGEVIGIVSCCYNADCFDITQAGYTTGLTGNVRNDISGPLTPMILNTTYFLSENVSGLLTCIEPSTDNYLSKSVLIATSSSTGWIFPYAAYVISSGVTEGGPLIKSMCLPISPYTMTSTDYFVGVAGGGVVLLPTSPKSGMVVVIADISGTALVSPIQIYGTIIGPQAAASINTDNGSLTFIWNDTTWSVIGFAPTAYQ